MGLWKLEGRDSRTMEGYCSSSSHYYTTPCDGIGEHIVESFIAQKQVKSLLPGSVVEHASCGHPLTYGTAAMKFCCLISPIAQCAPHMFRRNWERYSIESHCWIILDVRDTKPTPCSGSVAEPCHDGNSMEDRCCTILGGRVTLFLS